MISENSGGLRDEEEAETDVRDVSHVEEDDDTDLFAAHRSVASSITEAQEAPSSSPASSAKRSFNIIQRFLADKTILATVLLLVGEGGAAATAVVGFDVIIIIIRWW